MGDDRAIDYQDIIKAHLPKGGIWNPKSFELNVTTGVELVTNGTFTTDISGWTDSSESNGNIAWTATGGGRMRMTTNVIP